MSHGVTFIDVSVTYPGTTGRAVSDVNLDVAEGEFLVLVGPSGCGKSTCLRAVAGLEPVSSGTILIGGRDVTRVPAKDRDVAMVFQNYALYPHMTVAENMGFALKMARTSKDEVRRRVAEAARLLDLNDYLDRRPKALSGGQRQRVAMGRAIVREPAAFLMDEPLSNLDAKLRVQTRTQIASLQRRLGTTTIYVTHDQVEAMTMGDRVAVLRDGVLQQVATPGELYQSPANAFVAQFIGSPSMNLVDVPIVDGGVDLAGLLIPVPRNVLAGFSTSRALLGIRPEDLRIEQGGATLTVELVEALGADTFVYGSIITPAGPVTIVVRTPPTTRLSPGTTISVRPARHYLFDGQGEQRRLG